MDNGIDIDETQFAKLPVKEQNKILYSNLREIKIMIKSYRFQQRIQWIGLGLLISVGAYLFKIIIEKGG